MHKSFEDMTCFKVQLREDAICWNAFLHVWLFPVASPCMFFGVKEIENNHYGKARAQRFPAVAGIVEHETPQV